ncbi:unnamed protein product [Ilex paraguariensis]|uniref:Tetraspanin-19 n=1 Tax=Ilex paraguariensis TaxID=185542 RepID=A0ABC8UC95_9AQUA
MARSCIQSLLKLVNSVIGMVGVAMLLYALWMLRVWGNHTGHFPHPFIGPDTPVPWFIYTFLGLGVTLCVITCSGHIAAETANGCCLFFCRLFHPANEKHSLKAQFLAARAKFKATTLAVLIALLN